MFNPDCLSEEKERPFNVLRIGLDADDTCFDITQLSLKIFNQTYGTHYIRKDIDTFWYIQSFLKQIGVSKEEAEVFFNDLYRSPNDHRRVYRDSLPLPDAIKVISRTVYLEETVTPASLELMQTKMKEGYYALPSPLEQDPEKAITPELLEDEIAKAISSLPDNQRKIIKYRFWEDLTLEQKNKLVKKIGKSAETVRQIEAKALKNLCHPIISRKLRDFLNG